MFRFKEWLIAENIKTEIFYSVINEIHVETALKRTVKFLCETIEGSEENHLNASCKNCGFEGEFEEKEGDLFCPKCGKQEEIELPDPFADGKEDAKPIEDKGEYEPSEVEQEIEYLKQKEEEKKNKKEKKKSLLANSKRMSAEERQEKEAKDRRRLRNSILWIRWHSMMERGNDIKALRRLQELHEKENPKESEQIKKRVIDNRATLDRRKIDTEKRRNNYQAEIDESFYVEDAWDDDESALASGEKFNFEEAKKILQKLGYIDTDDEKFAYLPEKKKYEDVLEALYRASGWKDKSTGDRNGAESFSGETGNELPSDVDPKVVSRKVESARKHFADILMRQFSNYYSQIFNQDRNVGWANGRKGYKNIQDAADVASKFIYERLLPKLTNRPWLEKKNGIANLDNWSGFSVKCHRCKGSRKIKVGEQEAKCPECNGQGVIKQLGTRGANQELQSDFFVDEILKVFRSWLFKEPSKTASATNRTIPSGAADEISNRSRKGTRINKDIEAAAKSGMGKNAKSLSVYVNYLELAKTNQQSTMTFEKSDEKNTYRLEIMKDIEEKRSTRPDLLSMDPDKIIETLSNYRTHFILNKSKKSVSSFSGLSQSGSGGGENGEEAYFDPESTDSVMRGDKGGNLIGGYSTPDSGVAGEEIRETILSALYQTMSRLSQLDKKAALALCVKWGLDCNPQVSNSTWENPDEEDWKVTNSPININYVINSNSQNRTEVGADDNGMFYMYHLDDVKSGPLGKFLPPGSHYALIKAKPPTILQAQIASKESLEAFSQQIVQNKKGTDCIKQLYAIGHIKTDEELAQSISRVIGFPVQKTTASNWLKKALDYVCKELGENEEMRSVFDMR